ncbi:MAG: anthranilate phosphoribosyltransferase [Deltaproteobacteria bacterium]|nr:anthranilate phosphoribosyltransferase [Deltaproteobacteria bacterium]
MIAEAIRTAVEGTHLSRELAAGAIDAMLEGQATEAQMAALLVALRMKGETIDEIVGAAQALRRRAQRVDVNDTARERLIDTCGTGGDGAHTFNISTTAAFVAAAGGAFVAKHGNRAVSSQCGSADVLAALGVELELTPANVGACIEEVGIGFLFAPRHHAATRHVAPVRKMLGLRTVFNLLGPLVNPAGARRQVMGVYAHALVPVVARTLVELGCDRAFVVHGSGLDELTLAGSTRVCEVRDGSVREFEVVPEQLGLSRAPIEALRGGDAKTNADILRAVLRGENGPRRDAVVLNAGAALAAAGLCEALREGLELARKAIDSGAALDRQERLVAISKQKKLAEGSAS